MKKNLRSIINSRAVWMAAFILFFVVGLASILSIGTVGIDTSAAPTFSTPPPKTDAPSLVTQPVAGPIEWISAAQLTELSLAVMDVERLPSGDYDCYVESDGDEPTPTFGSKKERSAYERAKKKEKEEATRYVRECEIARTREKTSYERARQALNKTWLPLLTNAMNHGDQIAEVILRLCGTATAIDRTGIASDCSEEETERQIARSRLESINFKPALFSYAHTSLSETTRHPCAGDYDAKTRCQIQADIDRYKRILAVMSTGYLSVAESWNTCQIRSDNEENDRLAEECQRLLYLMQSIAMLAPRAYSAQLSVTQMYRSTIDRLPGGTRVDWSPFRDPEFSKKLDVATKQYISEIEANIDLDLNKDPRWSFFLGERAAEFYNRVQ